MEAALFACATLQNSILINNTDTEIIAQKRCNGINCVKTKNTTVPFFFFFSLFAAKPHHIILTHSFSRPAPWLCKTRTNHRFLVSVCMCKTPKSHIHPSHCNRIQNTPPTASIISQAQQDKNNYCNGSTDAHKLHPVILQWKKYCSENVLPLKVNRTHEQRFFLKYHSVGT